MPLSLGGQFGYVFPNASNKTASHELGHGAFALQHPFSKSSDNGKTPFLIDYGTGTNLWHNDWAQINNPALKFYGFQGDSSGEYETDGHYSTVYLVSLMLGMNNDNSRELATATEAPDTDIHSETDFELDQTWAYPNDQEDIHSLTGGFHGTEEFLTALKFLFTPKNEIAKLGELLHRFGDSYAHTRLDNLTPENLSIYNLSENPENEISAINSWKGKGAENLSDRIEPWFIFFNYYLKKYGMGFFTRYNMQKDIFHGKTLKEVLSDIYLTNPTDKFIMYGGKKNIIGLTDDHAFSDGLKPDMIYIRPQWYIDYVHNLAWLISKKYSLNISNFNINTFRKMINFAKLESNKCSLKGIIDYEIAKKKGVTKFYIPVFYSKPSRIAASYDALINSDYYNIALDVVEKKKLYIAQDGIYKKVTIKVIKDLNVKFNFKTGFFRTVAFEVNLEK